MLNEAASRSRSAAHVGAKSIGGIIAAYDNTTTSEIHPRSCHSWPRRTPLEWLQNPALRRRVNAGLNKGEARNALARAVFFNRLGETRDRSFENQRYRASGLNLVVVVIALWNTVYLERAILALREQQPVDDALLKHLSP